MIGSMRSRWVVRGWVMMVLVFFVSAAALAQADGAAGETEEGGEGGKTVRVLTVGNSFSGNATQFLGKLAEAGGHELVLGQASFSGGPLDKHWARLDAWRKDPESKDAEYPGGKTLAESLEADRWDYVTVQQYSWLSHDPATYEPWAGELVAFIRERAPRAGLLVHQTWAYRVDDPRFDPGHGSYGQPGEGPKSQREMYERLTSAYDELAERYGAGVIPVGDAFYRADTDGAWGFEPEEVDVSALEPPALPDQSHSLHVGYVWRKNKDGTPRLGYDGHHANLAGKYLGACVWYEVLFGESVVDNPFVPEGLDGEHAAFLRRVAHEAVAAREAAAVTSGG